MKNSFRSHRLTACISAFLAITAGSTIFAASSTLSDYLYETGQLIPDKFDISLSETVSFNDNINEGTPSEAHSAWEFNTDLNFDIYKTLGNSIYGLNGSVGWNHFHNGNRDSEPDINLSPRFSFGQDQGNLMLSADVRYKDESLSNSDRRFAKYYDSVIRIAYDLNSHERYGMILAGDLGYQYYTEDDFDNKDNASYGFSLAPYYRVSPKTRTGLRFGYERTDYRKNREHDDLEELFLNLFVSYQISLKVNLMAEAGFSRSSYTGGAASGTTGDDEISGNYRLMLTYHMLSNLFFNLSLSHEPEDSFELGARGLTQRNKSSVGMNWLISPKLSLNQRLSCYVDDEKTTRMDTTQYEYDVRLNYQLRKQINLYTGYTYSTTHFKYEEDFNFKSNEVNLGLSWQF